MIIGQCTKFQYSQIWSLVNGAGLGQFTINRVSGVDGGANIPSLPKFSKAWSS